MNRNVKGLKPSLLTFHLYQFLFHHAVPWISFSVAILTLLRVWKKMLPAVSVNKGCCSCQPITFQPRWQWALRELTVETGCPPSSHQPLQPPLTADRAPWGRWGWKDTGSWPQQAHWNQWAQTFASSQTQRSTKLINLRYLTFCN